MGKRVLAAIRYMLAFVVSPIQARVNWSHEFDFGSVPTSRVWSCNLGS